MEEFQKWENIKQKQEAGNTCQKREVSSQNGRVQVSDTVPGGFPRLNSTVVEFWKSRHISTPPKLLDKDNEDTFPGFRTF